MMLKDFRDSFTADLQDATFQRELISVAFDENGPEGILNALRLVASASRELKPVAAATPLIRRGTVRGNRD